jgi:Predicted transcriptional regulators
MRPRGKDLETSFLYRVDKTPSCWLWQGSLTALGYGRLHHDGTRRPAHRLSWELYRGTIPKELHVLHKCDVRNCVNPTHLFLGTHLDNMRDCVSKGRHVLPPRRRGGQIQNSVLTEDDVRKIRGLSGMTQRAIAKEFGVSFQTINLVLHGKTWKHVA